VNSPLPGLTGRPWLAFELALFRDASFENARLYVIVMVVIGAGYLGRLLARRGRGGLVMPDQHSIDAVLDLEAGIARP
jgi:hypothetical protein